MPVFIPESELARRVAFGRDWIRERIEAGEFGAVGPDNRDVLRVDGEFFLSLDVCRRWLSARTVGSVEVLVVESHAPLSALAWTLGRSVTYLRDHLAEFGPRVVRLGGEVRVPASGVYEWAAAHRAPELVEFKARTRGELMRRLAGKRAALAA